VSAMRIAFVYPNPRAGLEERVAAGEAPDTNLLGQNHLRALGVDAFVYDSVLRRRTPSSPVVHRLTWHARELTLPFELRHADLIVTPLANLLPLVTRIPRTPPVLLLSYHLVAAWERAGTARRRLLRASLHSAAGVVTVADAAREQLLERVGLERSVVRTATLGVDAAWWTPSPVPADGHVLTVGRDLARDYETFARAMRSVDRRAIVVAKEENVRGLSLPENVEVRLNLSPIEVRDLTRGASCVVVPVRPASDPRGTENSGTVAMLEAMACGRPVVVSDRVYLRDYSSPETALTVPPGDAAAMASAVAQVLGDPTGAARVGAAARRAVEERHSTRHFAQRLLEVIEDLPGV
jgi:glycosyltransferase involved in cell wall biosynthesis